jgi:hypothetical protein
MIGWKRRHDNGQAFHIRSSRYIPLNVTKEAETVARKRNHDLRKAQKPSFSARSVVKSDVKKMMRTDDINIGKEAEFDKYKGRLDREMETTHIKEAERTDRKRENTLNKAERLEEKAEKLKQEIGES